MVSKTDANGNVTAFGYRGADLISIQPPGNKNGATTFSYARSVMVEERTPVGRKTFLPDAQGNIVRITEFGPSGPALNGNGTRAAYTESGLQTAYTDPRVLPNSPPRMRVERQPVNGNEGLARHKCRARTAPPSARASISARG